MHSPRYLQTGLRDSSRLLIIIIALHALVGIVNAKFSQAACSGGSCLQRNWQDISSAPCEDNRLQAALLKHTKDQTSSIAYFTYDTTVRLGDANWPVSAWAEGSIVLCITGMVLDQQFISSCRNVTKDDEFVAPDAPEGDDGCHMRHSRGQSVLRDRCCGPPRTLCPAPEPDTALGKVRLALTRAMPKLSWRNLFVLLGCAGVFMYRSETARHVRMQENEPPREKQVEGSGDSHADTP
ncbi:hypothetical protein BKA62DRAFT_701262 [Auriculariales sp. MPI-PUGE-AT-0066]|nr:hypothetical protein BKA62DRAFT_701262 [Auriculariales sp. MPI-PUGE-AT-0066]